jgi:hypothetical protein
LRIPDLKKELLGLHIPVRATLEAG